MPPHRTTMASALPPVALPVDATTDDDPDAVVVGVPAGTIVAVVEPMVDPVDGVVDDPPMEPVHMVPSHPLPFPWTTYGASFLVVAGAATGTVVACIHEAWSAAILTALVATVTVVAVVVHATNECHWLRHDPLDPLHGTVRDVDRLRRPRRLSPVALDTCGIMVPSHPDLCSICLDQPGRRLVLPCLHAYHPECIGAWFERRRTCPLCGMDPWFTPTVRTAAAPVPVPATSP